MVLGRVVAVATLALSPGVRAQPERWPGSDPGVAPGVDFFQYANGGWADKTPIPPDRAGVSTASTLNATAQQRVHDLLVDAASRADTKPTDDAGKVGAYFASYMDELGVERLGGRPLRQEMTLLRRVTTHVGLARLMGRANVSFQASLFSLWIEPDSRDPDRYAVYLGQAGLGLASPDDYVAAEGAPRRAAYAAYVAKMLRLVGWPDPGANASAVLAFETRLAGQSWSTAQRRDESRIYNPTAPIQLEHDATGFAWSTYFEAAGLRPDRIIVTDRDPVIALAKAFADTPVATLKAWAAFHLVDNAATVLSQAYVAAWSGFHDQVLQGSHMQPRWLRALRQVSGGGWKGIEQSRGAMGDAVGQLYVARWLDPSSSDRLRQLAEWIRQALRRRIATQPWLSEQASKEALLKVDAYQLEIGAPAHWDDDKGLTIVQSDLFGNVERATAHAWAGDLSRLGRPVDRELWQITPQTVNAYNYAPWSKIIFTAALLQPPAFDAAQDDAVSYGGIGAIIGHELTHAFDDVGRRFDHDGHLRDWWSPADSAQFAAKARKIVDLFSACEAAPGLKVDGDLTLGENIADIGGLQLALDAYHASLQGRPAGPSAEYSGDQRFFLGFAELRRGKRRPEALRNDVRSDPHTPDRCRVNQDVRQIDGWYQAFDIEPGDPMYLAPSGRAGIW